MNKHVTDSSGRRLVRGFVAASAAVLVGGAVAMLGALVSRELLSFGIVMPAGDHQGIDPNAPIVVTALGIGTRLAAVDLKDDGGRILDRAADIRQATLSPALAFGTRYTLTVTAERFWTGQRETQERVFTTAYVPRLEGATERMLAADASVTLQFDRPVGSLAVTGDLGLEVQPDPSRQTIRLVARGYTQGHTYPVRVDWQTPEGVQLPSWELQLTTPPALTAEVNTSGLSNLGVAMPLQLTFSEPLSDAENAGRQIAVRTIDGESVPGKWRWVAKRRLQFSPQPQWPASSTIQVSAAKDGLKSLNGGTLDQPLDTSFRTGTDRRIFVYLDKQKLVAVENGEPVRTVPVSTGKAATPTITGSFHIYARFPTKTMRSRARPGEKGHYIVENVPYAQYFYEDYALHGAWWHNGFGRPASHGCVNLPTRKNNRRWPASPEEAGWLYRWASLGVPVTVYAQTPRDQQVAMQ